MAQSVRSLNLIANAKIQREVVSCFPIILHVLAEKMIRFIGGGRCSHARTVQDAKQHLGHSITGGDTRSLQGIWSSGEVSVERKRVGIVVELAEDLLHSHEPEVQCVSSVRLNQVNRDRTNGAMVRGSLRVPGEWAKLGDPISNIDDWKQWVLLRNVARQSQSRRGVETERLIVRGFVP